jgi:hypothetical protein
LSSRSSPPPARVSAPSGPLSVSGQSFFRPVLGSGGGRITVPDLDDDAGLEQQQPDLHGRDVFCLVPAAVRVQQALGVDRVGRQLGDDQLRVGYESFSPKTWRRFAGEVKADRAGA